MPDGVPPTPPGLGGVGCEDIPDIASPDVTEIAEQDKRVSIEVKSLVDVYLEMPEDIRAWAFQPLDDV